MIVIGRNQAERLSNMVKWAGGGFPFTPHELGVRTMDPFTVIFAIAALTLFILLYKGKDA